MLLAFFTAMIGVATCSVETSEMLLLNKLFSNYSTHVRPRSGDKSSSATNIRITFFPINLIELDEKSQFMHIRLQFVLYWEDKRLGWIPNDHGGIQTLFYPLSGVWRPPVSFQNDISHGGKFGHEDNVVTIDSHSTISWIVQQTVKLSCEIDVTFYPFDKQTCTIMLYFNPMTTSDVIASPPQDGVGIVAAYFEKSGTWEYLEIRCYFGKEKYQLPRYEIVLRRRTTFYLLNIVLPVVFLSTTASVVFLLPAEAGEKMGVSITVLLAYSVYLSIIADSLPQTSSQLCYIQVYITLLLGITALGVLLAVVVLHFHHKPAHVTVGKKTAAVVKRLRILCSSDRNKISPSSSHGNQSHLTQSDNGNILPREDIGRDDVTKLSGDDNLDGIPPIDLGTGDVTWPEVAKTIDRVIFALFSGIIFLGTLWTFTYISTGRSHTTSRDLQAPDCEE